MYEIKCKGIIKTTSNTSFYQSVEGFSSMYLFLLGSSLCLLCFGNRSCILFITLVYIIYFSSFCNCSFDSSLFFFSSQFLWFFCILFGSLSFCFLFSLFLCFCLSFFSLIFWVSWTNYWGFWLFLFFLRGFRLDSSHQSFKLSIFLGLQLLFGQLFLLWFLLYKSQILTLQ